MSNNPFSRQILILIIADYSGADHAPEFHFHDINRSMPGHPTLALVLLCLVGTAFMAYNFYRAWFRLDEMRSFLNDNIDSMKTNTPWQGFFRRRVNYPGWAVETRVVATINLALAVILTAFVLYLYLAQ